MKKILGCFCFFITHISLHGQNVYHQEERLLMELKSNGEKIYTYNNLQEPLSYQSKVCCNDQFDFAYEWLIFNKTDSVSFKVVHSKENDLLISNLDSIQKLNKAPYVLGGKVGSNAIFSLFPVIRKSIKINDSTYVLVCNSRDRKSELSGLIIVEIKEGIPVVLNSVLFRKLDWVKKASENQAIVFLIDSKKREIYLEDKTNQISNQIVMLRNNSGKLSPIKPQKIKATALANASQIIYKINDISNSEFVENDSLYYTIRY